jgi:hypothetical protein
MLRLLLLYCKKKGFAMPVHRKAFDQRSENLYMRRHALPEKPIKLK